jgi:hypothetical protein
LLYKPQKKLKSWLREQQKDQPKRLEQLQGRQPQRLQKPQPAKPGLPQQRMMLHKNTIVTGGH